MHVVREIRSLHGSTHAVFAYEKPKSVISRLFGGAG
jgi:hypothetical protein